jgi:hypothetical protein
MLLEACFVKVGNGEGEIKGEKQLTLQIPNRLIISLGIDLIRYLTASYDKKKLLALAHAQFDRAMPLLWTHMGLVPTANLGRVKT